MDNNHTKFYIQRAKVIFNKGPNLSTGLFNPSKKYPVISFGLYPINYATVTMKNQQTL